MVCGNMAVCVLVRWGPIFSAHWCRVLGWPSTNQVAFVHRLMLLKTMCTAVFVTQAQCADRWSLRSGSTSESSGCVSVKTLCRSDIAGLRSKGLCKTSCVQTWSSCFMRMIVGCIFGPPPSLYPFALQISPEHATHLSDLQAVSCHIWKLHQAERLLYRGNDLQL
jgi:hypothetical protein